MKITQIETLFIDRYLFVQVHTDAGLTGLGESGAWGYLEASAGAVETFKRYLIGQDPLRIEHHWQYLYRWTHFRGAAIMGALSAIDLALWDIAGKHFGMPCYQLLGGKCRDKARVYYHVFGRTKEELIQGCIDAKNRGFTAVGHLTPFLDEPREAPYFETHAQKMSAAIETVGRYREAVGNDVDLCIEIHRRLTPAEALAAATINAAWAVRRGDRVGSLEPGKQADLVIWRAPTYQHLSYRFGSNLARTVIKRGQVVYEG